MRRELRKGLIACLLLLLLLLLLMMLPLLGRRARRAYRKRRVVALYPAVSPGKIINIGARGIKIRRAHNSEAGYPPCVGIKAMRVVMCCVTRVDRIRVGDSAVAGMWRRRRYGRDWGVADGRGREGVGVLGREPRIEAIAIGWL